MNMGTRVDYGTDNRRSIQEAEPWDGKFEGDELGAT